MRVAIVDDSMFSRMQLKKKLAEIDSSLEFTEFADGEKAVEGIPNGGFALVTMDLTMPNKGGIDALKEIREAGVEIPIYIISADIQQTTRQLCEERGCTGFIAKPFETENLKMMMEAI